MVAPSVKTIMVRPFRVVKHKVFRQSQQQLRHGGVAFQIQVLMFDAAPEPFHKEIVQRPASPVHAKRDAVRLGASVNTALVN